MVLQTKATKQSKILKFPKANILEEGIEQVNHSLTLKREFFMDNLGRDNVKIFFIDDTGVKEIDASYWTLTQKSVILKESIAIPLSSIVAVA